MPVYEYECKKCGKMDIYLTQGETKTECPFCAGTIKRVYTSTGTIFKGSGFYSTDNKGKKKE